MGANASAARAEALCKEYVETGAGMLYLGGLTSFYASLTARIGSPDPKILEAMMKEHCSTPDSQIEFTTFYLTTTSEIEWKFVTQPDADVQWPVEKLLKQDANAADKMRKPTSAEALHGNMQQINAQIEELGADPVSWSEVIGAKLFTGPMHVKYNCVLRGLDSPVPFLKNLMIKLCCAGQVWEEYHGTAKMWAPPNGTLSYDNAKKQVNFYTTSIHVINSCIVKMGKLTKVQPVYRGMSGRIFPEAVLVPNEQGITAGVEFGFLSASTARADAERESQDAHGMIIELEQDAISRGADLTLLSQYPHESRVVFAPSCLLQLVELRVDTHPLSGKEFLVVEMRVSVSQANPTIDQTVTKRRAVVDELCHCLGQVSKFK